MEIKVSLNHDLNCKADISDGFELAIKQLGYEIIDSSWDDENDRMSYKVTKTSIFFATEEMSVEKYHVVIKDKKDNRWVWAFTGSPVSKIEAEKIANDIDKGKINDDYYLDIELQ